MLQASLGNFIEYTVMQVFVCPGMDVVVQAINERGIAGEPESIC